MNNYYVDGKWFAHYINARDYADQLMEDSGRYYVVFTKAEKDATINHVEECGK